MLNMAHQLLMALLRKSDFMFVAGQFSLQKQRNFQRAVMCTGIDRGRGP